jgi:hypothetical protein
MTLETNYGDKDPYLEAKLYSASFKDVESEENYWPVWDCALLFLIFCSTVVWTQGLILSYLLGRHSITWAIPPVWIIDLYVAFLEQNICETL